MHRTLAAIFLLLIAIATEVAAQTWAEALDANLRARTPKGYTLLTEGGPPCGPGHYYFVQSGAFPEQHLVWAKRTFAIIYFPVGHSYVATEYTVAEPLATQEARLRFASHSIFQELQGKRSVDYEVEELFATPEYLNWLGRKGKALVERVLTTRAIYLAQLDSLPPPTNLRELLRAKPVSDYRQARRAAHRFLIDKLQLRVVGDGLVC